jgi:hypothetical protein
VCAEPVPPSIAGPATNCRFRPERAPEKTAPGHFAPANGQFCPEVARQRRQLFTLDERVLKDIGVTRADADREAGRDFWDIPEDQMPAAWTG